MAAARRIEMERLQELVRLHRMKTKVKEVARLLKMSPNTERNYREALIAAELLHGDVNDLPELSILKEAVLRAMPPPKIPQHEQSAIEPWRDRLEKLMSRGLGPKVIRERLIEQTKKEGILFDGTYPQVKRMYRSIKEQKGVNPGDVAIVVESEPGEVAQVDFGYVGRLLETTTGTLRKAWCFVMVLGFSRHMAVRVVFDQKLETWQRLHIECFQELGGVPTIIRPDNLKAAVIKAAFSPDQPTELNRSYRELARHYDFKVAPTPPYAPKKKGKVERGVKYVKNSFFKGREGQDIDVVRHALADWVNETAGLRTHGTTGKQPKVVFEQQEQDSLLPLPSAPYELVIWKKAKVHKDTHVSFDGRLYSVPWPLVGTDVWLRATPSSVVAYAEDERVATHSRRGPDRRSTIEDHLPEHRRKWRHRKREYWEEVADAMGEEIGQLVREIFDADDVLYQLRTVQSIMKLLESYPLERARAACSRASFYGITSYGAVKKILQKGLDRQPLPTAVELPSGCLSEPKYARNLSELLANAREESCHEPH